MKRARKSRARRPISRTRVYVPLKVNIWVGPKDGRIRIVAPGKFISTVAATPGARCHKHLYAKLRTVLRNRGKWLA